jgi:cellulose synthase/poly-beta-1,6-N-acetylglucosamine synthase-like glycosyltransferase
VARIEIIIGHDRSSPAPSIEVPPGVRLRTVPGDEPGGKAASLNAALRAAGTDFVVFADTYQRYGPDTIPHLVGALLQPGVGAVTGAYRLTPGTGKLVSLYWSFERWLRRTEARVHSSVGATGAVYAIRRALWKPLPAGLILDDVFTPMNIVLAGQRVAVADGALALETRTPTPRQEYGRKVRTLTGVIQLCAWLPSVIVPFRNPIWVQFMFHKVLRLLTPWFVLGIGVWAAWSLGGRLDSLALAVCAGLAALTGLWLAVSGGRVGSRLRRIIVEALLIQVAVLVAGFNGLRGHWRVWDA